MELVSDMAPLSLVCEADPKRQGLTLDSCHVQWAMANGYVFEVGKLSERRSLSFADPCGLGWLGSGKKRLIFGGALRLSQPFAA